MRGAKRLSPGSQPVMLRAMRFTTSHACFSRYPTLTTITLSLALWCGCSTDRKTEPEPILFADHAKSGDLSLMIVGSYFHNSYVLELTQIAQTLSPRARQIIFCTELYKDALTPFLAANGVQNVQYVTFDDSSPVLTQWARDVVVAGKRGDESTIVVSPYKHAGSESDAALIARTLERVLPDRSIRLAPFVFESGNLAFVDTGGRRVLIAGKKILFDNEVYQGRSWARGYDARSLLAAMAETFEVDTVMVVGRARKRPDTRMYFEYHIDMGMAILSGNRAVVAKLSYGQEEQAALALAIDTGHPVTTPFLARESDRDRLSGTLSERLHTVAAEYDDYASLLEGLGLKVYRSAVGWKQVLGSMSWTNVLQFPGRILMPLYPDSLHGRTTSVANAGGQLNLSLDVSRIADERFELEGRNAEQYKLYSDLGYGVVTVPEYLHYMMGGVHCFVNILE